MKCHEIFVRLMIISLTALLETHRTDSCCGLCPSTGGRLSV